PAERNRRSVYVFVRRNTRYPLFDSFDMPDPHESCSRRNVTTSPLQALTLLNSHLSVAWAQAFAERVFASAGPDETRQVQQAFRLAYGRLPDDTERQIAREFFAGHRKALLERSHALETTPRSVEPGSGIDDPQGAALIDFCHALMNANVFIYQN